MHKTFKIYFCIYLQPLRLCAFAFNLFAFLLLTGCGETYLSVHNEYLSHQNLASYHVDTPDPLLISPPIGQRLIVCWTLPKKYKCMSELYLDVTIQFRNHEQMSEQFYLPRLKGTYIYDLLNDEYIAKKGFLSYKIDLVADGTVITEWRHQMWTELIVIPPEPIPPPYDEEYDDEECDEE